MPWRRAARAIWTCRRRPSGSGGPCRQPARPEIDAAPLRRCDCPLTPLERLVNVRASNARARAAAWSDDHFASAGPTRNFSAGRRAVTVSDYGHQRRTVLKGAIGLGLTLPLAQVHAAEEDDPKKARPQEGDRFVFFSGDRKGEVIKVEDLPVGGPQTLAYPMDPATETVRNGSRLNQVLLIRLEPGQLSKDTSANAAEG